MGEASSHSARRSWRRVVRRLSWLSILVIGFSLLAAVPVFAGQASSGELFFYPCTSCHPLHLIPGTNKPVEALPNGFQGHQIVLIGHNKLGLGQAACLACHDDPTRNPGMLKAIDGSLIDIKGDVALVCYRCHSTKYKEWKAGTHGKHKPSCVAAGCHDPHTPGFIYSAPAMPFVGTGTQFKVLSERAVFRPYAGPAPDPKVIIPIWFLIIVALGLLVALVLVGRLVTGRFQQ